MEHTNNILKILNRELEPYMAAKNQVCIDGVLTAAQRIDEYIKDNPPNCLGVALRFWDKNRMYKLYYNSDHVINSPVYIKEHWLPVEDFGYDYFVSAFKGLLTDEEKLLLKQYFTNDVLIEQLKKSEIL